MRLNAINKFIARYQVESLSDQQKLELANRVFEKIKEHDAIPNPVHYTVIYEAIQNIDPKLSQQIQKVMEAGNYSNDAADTFFNELISSYLFQHLPTQQVETLLKNLLGQIEKWIETSRLNQETVVNGINHLSDCDIPDSIKECLHDEILPSIKAMLRCTEDLQNGANEASGEIKQLKMELEQANLIAKTDELTNIPNRRGLNEAAEQMLERTQLEEDFTFSLIILDIDFFKAINDEFGHLVGDSVLRYLAKQLHKETKGKDFVARLGGEEFIILLPHTNLENAMHVAESLRAKIETTKLKVTAYKKDLQLTVSCGVATFDQNHDKNIDEMIGRADKALYSAKSTGRNNVKSELDL